MNPATALVAVKLTHTVIWAFFAGCILAIPVFAYRGQFTVAAVLIAVVLVEVFVLVFNHWRCPLTGVAARYTDERQDNFDIYLPHWLAKHNKTIFSLLFVVGIGYTLIRWWLTKLV